MANIELVIKISEKVKQAFDNAESNELKGGYYDNRGIIGNAIKNAIPLPKGHGRLIDADVLANGFEDNYEFCEVVNATPTIINANKE